jgi:hypothetical protein
MKPVHWAGALAAALLPLGAAAAENYLGILKPPRTAVADPAGFYSFASIPGNALGFNAATENGTRFKLGYKYSRYVAVEGQFNEYMRPGDVFGSQANLASAFRGSGFGVDTVATLPLWRFSFYGRLGAYRGDGRSPFTTHSAALLSDAPVRGTRLRYGLGMRYDFTSALGIQAEVERYSPLGAMAPGEPESDLFSVGLRWRF